VTERQALIEHLSQFALEGRWQLLQEKVGWRTKHIALILEDIYQPQNASAVLRTADCFGIQDVHIVEDRNEYEVNPDVALGSSNWVSMQKYENIETCIQQVKEKGYRVVATSPLQNAVPISDFDVSRPFALMFGTEKRGLSEKAFSLADERVYIPMYGFTESFNISVSAAICCHEFSERLRRSTVDWKLSPEEAEDVLLNWLRVSVRSSAQIEARFLKEFKSKNP
jgi:tRNA (guanosine-2'-O-)-methyltransferase